MGNMSRLAAAAVLLGLPAAASAVTINFDVDGSGNPIAANTPITNQYANLGVTFRGIEDGSDIGINAAPDPDNVSVPSVPNVLTNCVDASPACPGNRADIVEISFAAPVSDISLLLSTLGGESVTFNLYDSVGTLLETLSASSGGSLYIPISFTALGVSRIEGLQPNDEWAWAMDDLTFTAGDAVVPEPASWAMMIAGFGLIGGAMRRRSGRSSVRFA